MTTVATAVAVATGVAVSALLLAVLALGWARRVGRDRSRVDPVQAEGARPGGLSDPELTFQAWLEEIEAAGEQAVRQLAAAETRLRGLLQDAEETLTRLQVLAATPALPEPAGERPGTAETEGEGSPAAGPEQEEGLRQEGEEEAEPRAPWASEVRRLSADGLAPVEIARRLGVGRGEVELLLGLGAGGPRQS